MRMATCHPGRKHKAKGLCGSCYQIERLTRNVATCHPERGRYAGGLCRNCYAHKNYMRHREAGIQKSRSYYVKNRDALLEKERVKRQENPEAVREARRKAYLATREYKLAKARLDYASNVDERRRLAAIYREANRARVNANSLANYHAKKALLK